jgi:hypothetical protein
MLGTPFQTKLTFLANLLTFLRILLQRKLDYDNIKASTFRLFLGDLGFSLKVLFISLPVTTKICSVHLFQLLGGMCLWLLIHGNDTSW